MHGRRNKAFTVLLLLLGAVMAVSTSARAAPDQKRPSPAVVTSTSAPAQDTDDKPPRLALLVGIKNYSKSWWPLPYVSIDLANMISACLRSGIDSRDIWVTTDVTRKELEDQLRKSGIDPMPLGFHLSSLPAVMPTETTLDRPEEVDPATFMGKINNALENLKDVKVGETLLFYFSGHGVALDDARYLAMPTSNSSRETSMLPVDDLLAHVRAFRGDAASIVIIDACAAVVDGRPIWTGAERSHRGQLTVLYAAKASQFSFSASGKGSYYTYYLTRAIAEPRLAFENEGSPKELRASHVCLHLRRTVARAVQEGLLNGTLRAPESRPGKKPFDTRQIPTSTISDDPLLRLIE